MKLKNRKMQCKRRKESAFTIEQENKLPLKYYHDKQGNYIIYRYVTTEEPIIGVHTKAFYVKDILLSKKNTTEELEKVFDSLAQYCIKQQIKKFELKSEKDFSGIKIIGNYVNMDKNDLTKKSINFNKIDKDNTHYRLIIGTEYDFPLTLHYFLSQPWTAIKFFFSTIIGKFTKPTFMA